MTNAEHLIENAIYALKKGRDCYEEEMKVYYNQMMLKEVGISKEDLYSMAVHVVYSLYDGEFPEGL